MTNWDTYSERNQNGYDREKLEETTWSSQVNFLQEVTFKLRQKFKKTKVIPRAGGECSG